MDRIEFNGISYFLSYSKRFVSIGKLRLRYMEDGLVFLFW